MPYFCRNIRREGYLGRPAARFSHKTTVIYDQTIDDNGIYGVEEYRSGSAALNLRDFIIKDCGKGFKALG